VLCDRALLGAYVQGKERVDRATLAQAAREVFDGAARRDLTRPLLAVLVLTVAAAMLFHQFAPPEAARAREPGAAARAATPAESVGQAKPAAALPDTQPDTLHWPQDQPRERSRDLAYAALFRAWGADYRPGDACNQAQTVGLRCRTARGGLDELRRFNRPAVLQMRDAAGQSYFAALTGLDDKSASLAFGAQSTTVALGALAAQWSGHYTLLWRTPPEVPGTIRPGEGGPAVQWLGAQLAQVQGRTAEAEPVFDDAMARHLREFQLAQGLVPDGALGPQTLARLSVVADHAAPKLVREQRRN
jgi:general secretion pathway protein A